MFSFQLRKHHQKKKNDCEYTVHYVLLYCKLYIYYLGAN